MAYGYDSERVLCNFIFGWKGRREAERFYGQSGNPGLSVMSSGPFAGTVSRETGDLVESTSPLGISALGGEATLAREAAHDDVLSKRADVGEPRCGLAGH